MVFDLDTFGLVLGEKVSYKLVKYPESYPQDEPSRRLPSLEKIKRELNYKPSVKLEDGLLRTFKLLKEEFKD